MNGSGKGDWEGPPKWDGGESPVEVKGLIFPSNPIFGPVMVLLYDCEDFFIPMFSKEEDLRAYMEYMQEKLFKHKFLYDVKQVDDPKAFFDSVYHKTVEGRTVRLMLNPQIITDKHTKWTEIVKDGDEWKYADPEKN